MTLSGPSARVTGVPTTVAAAIFSFLASPLSEAHRLLFGLSELPVLFISLKSEKPFKVRKPAGNYDKCCGLLKKLNKYSKKKYELYGLSDHEPILANFIFMDEPLLESEPEPEPETEPEAEPKQLEHIALHLNAE